MQVLIAILVWALAPSRQRAEESRCMAQEPKHIMENTTCKEEHATATRSALIFLIHTSLAVIAAVIAAVSTGYLFVACGCSLRGSKRHGLAKVPEPPTYKNKMPVLSNHWWCFPGIWPVQNVARLHHGVQFESSSQFPSCEGNFRLPVALLVPRYAGRCWPVAVKPRSKMPSYWVVREEYAWRSHAIPAYQLSDVPGREAKITWSATKTLPAQGMRLIGRLLLQNVESVEEDV